jgi:hypothetical protein
MSQMERGPIGNVELSEIVFGPGAQADRLEAMQRTGERLFNVGMQRFNAAYDRGDQRVIVEAEQFLDGVLGLYPHLRAHVSGSED